MANKTIYSPEVAEFVASEITSGSKVTDIAESLGINPDTIHLWKKNKSELKVLIAKKRLELKQYHVKKIESDSSWQSSAWMLERRYTDEFGPPAKNLNVSGKIELVHLVDTMTPISIENFKDEDQKLIE